MAWIISGALMSRYENWLCLQEQAGESLEGKESDGKPSVPSNANHIPFLYLPKDKMKAFSKISRYGMTLGLLEESHGEELLMWYREDFHAKTYPLQVKAKGLREKEAGCGEKWRGLLAKLDPNSCTWKTAQCSLFEDLESSFQTFPRWGLMRNGECYQQKEWVHPTFGSVFGFLLPTPVKSDGSCGDVISKSKTYYTTKNGMPRHVNENGVDGSVGLARFVKMFPTPCASDYKGAGKKGKTRDRLDYAVERGQTKNSIFEPNENGGRLNPDWVDWMMNFPVGWTSLKDLNANEWKKWNEADFSDLSNQWYHKEPTEKTTQNNEMRADRLMAAGNAQVPACAAITFLILRGEP